MQRKQLSEVQEHTDVNSQTMYSRCSGKRLLREFEKVVVTRADRLQDPMEHGKTIEGGRLRELQELIIV